MTDISGSLKNYTSLIEIWLEDKDLNGGHLTAALKKELRVILPEVLFQILLTDEVLKLNQRAKTVISVIEKLQREIERDNFWTRFVGLPGNSEPYESFRSDLIDMPYLLQTDLSSYFQFATPISESLKLKSKNRKAQYFIYAILYLCLKKHYGDKFKKVFASFLNSLSSHFRKHGLNLNIKINPQMFTTFSNDLSLNILDGSWGYHFTVEGGPLHDHLVLRAYDNTDITDSRQFLKVSFSANSPELREFSENLLRSKL